MKVQKDPQIDLGPGVPGAQGSLLTCLLCVFLSTVLLFDWLKFKRLFLDLIPITAESLICLDKGL